MYDRNSDNDAMGTAILNLGTNSVLKANAMLHNGKPWSPVERNRRHQRREWRGPDVDLGPHAGGKNPITRSGVLDAVVAC